MFDAVDHLIGVGLLQFHRPTDGNQLQIAFSVEGDGGRALDAQPDLTRIRARRHDPVVFELVLVPVEDQIDAVVHLIVEYVPVRRNVGVPLSRIAADQIIDASFKLVPAGDRCAGVRAFKCKTKHGGR